MSVLLTETPITRYSVYQQIAFIPGHVREKEDDFITMMRDQDVQYGFITSINRETNTIFARYWRRYEEGKELRTRANSEGSDPCWIIPYHMVPNSVVDDILNELGL